MAKKSRSATRVLDVLGFFLQRPDQSFTFTQVITALGLSKATGHAILLSFVEGGYLERLPNRTFATGPALAGLKPQAAPPMAAANREMRLLADEFDVIASALFLEGDHMIVRDRAASVANLGLAEAASGRPYPLYPWGCVFHMNRPDMEIAWLLENESGILSEETKDDVRLGIRFVQANGFIASVTHDFFSPALGTPSEERLIANLRLDQSYHLRFLIAPVIEQNRDPVFALSLFGFRQPMTGGQVLKLGARLREACARIGDA